MKRKKTKEILVESFREIAAQKSIDKITIKEITDNCEYSQATFYRHFKDKYDLIAWDYVQILEGNLARMQTGDYTWKQVLLNTAYYHYENRDYLANLFQNTSGLYSFEQYMVAANVRYLLQYINKQVDHIDKMLERCLWGYCYGEVKNSSDWIQGKFEASPEEMAVIYEKTLPEPLKEYL